MPFFQRTSFCATPPYSQIPNNINEDNSPQKPWFNRMFNRTTLKVCALGLLILTIPLVGVLCLKPINQTSSSEIVSWQSAPPPTQVNCHCDHHSIPNQCVIPPGNSTSDNPENIGAIYGINTAIHSPDYHETHDCKLEELKNYLSQNGVKIDIEALYEKYCGNGNKGERNSFVHGKKKGEILTENIIWGAKENCTELDQKLTDLADIFFQRIKSA